MHKKFENLIELYFIKYMYVFYLFLVEKENMHDIFNLVSIFILYFIAIKRYLSWCLQGHHILFLSKQMWLFTTKEVFRFYFSLPRCIICPLYCAYVNIRLHTYTMYTVNIHRRRYNGWTLSYFQVFVLENIVHSWI